jgi:predicted ATPase/DNA-binding winged helix-turn-helix (wHTH) protein
VDEPILFPPFRLDRVNRRLYCGARPLVLRKKSLAVLEVLASRPRMLVTKSELMDAVWADTAVTETVLKVCVREIRKALGDTDERPRFIETVHGEGYRFLVSAHDHLPSSLGRFIGRTVELERIRSLLPQHRLVTLTGPGGVGKTRLAQEVIRGWAAPDGVWWIELAGVASTDRIAPSIARTLGIEEQRGSAWDDALARELRSTTMCLALDNCEHLLEGCAALVRRLLEACPRLRVLATSREALGVPGECVWEVPPLSAADAVALFLDRAPQPQVSRMIEGVCRRLDGLPLAIELAAARARRLGLEPLHKLLTASFDVLGARKGDVARHKTIEAAIDWSHRLLDESEKTLFARLAIFAGGWTLDQACAICDAQPPLLAQLIEKSLVMRTAASRYRMLEPIRAYALSRLPHQRDIIDRFVCWFARFAQEESPRLNSAGRRDAIATLDQDYDNLLAALQNAGPPDAERIACSLTWYWFHSGRWSEGRRILTPFLDAAASPRMLFADGLLAWATGDHASALARLEQAASTAIDTLTRGHSLQFLAMELLGRGDVDRAEAIAAEAVRVFGDEDPFGRASSLVGLGIARLARGDLAGGRRLLAESASISQAHGDHWCAALALRNLGMCAIRESRPEQAVVYLKESLAELETWPERWFVSRSIETLGIAEALRGESYRAAALFGAAEALRESIGAAILPFYQSDYDRAREFVRSQLDSAQLEEAWSYGRALQPADAVAFGLGEEL